jgi:hypothetical protein
VSVLLWELVDYQYISINIKYILFSLYSGRLYRFSSYIRLVMPNRMNQRNLRSGGETACNLEAAYNSKSFDERVSSKRGNKTIGSRTTTSPTNLAGSKRRETTLKRRVTFQRVRRRLNRLEAELIDDDRGEPDP